MLLDKRYNQQSIVEDYRYSVQDTQNWFESIAKALESLETGSGTTIENKMSKIKEIIANYNDNVNRTDTVKEKAEAVLKEVGEMDRQHVQEQTSSIERRMADIKRRIDRKKQIVEMAHGGYSDTKKDIDSINKWMMEKINYLQAKLPTSDPETRLQEVLTLSKETESKTMMLESLDNKVDTIKTDLEPAEHEELQNCLTKLGANQKVLSKLAKEMLKRESSMAEDRKRLDDYFESAHTWLNSKSTELLSTSGSTESDPLKAFAMEKKIAKLKKAEGEIKTYEENTLNKLRRDVMAVTKTDAEEDQQSYASDLKEVEQSFEELKNKLKTRIQSLEDKIDPRKQFEADLDASVQWLDKAENIVNMEMRGTVNIATLDEHLQKFKILKKEEDETRQALSQLVDQANGIMPTLGDADQLTLQSTMDEACDKLNQVSDATKKKVESLVKNIDHYRNTASKIEESVTHLNQIQREIKQLNKPIGHRVEDAEDVLGSYEKILADLKSFKQQLEDLHRTSGANVNELKALLQQQEELILAIENQMIKIKSLINVRHNFMELVTGITGFIIKYTEVVKEVERSNIPSAEKVKKYDEAIQKIEECETQLALATDKGQQIATEGSTQDRNKITEQLQSLKTQIHTLKRAIEKKRNEHIQSAADHQRLVGEIETNLDWLHEKESAVKSRPLLSTSVDDVEKELVKHSEMDAEIRVYLDRVKKIRDGTSSEENLPGSVANVLNDASALLHSLPQELQSRKQYLEDNKNHRLQYDSLVERLNNWVEEAQMKLRPFDSGVDYQNIESDYEEHKKYFSQETKLRDLLDKIHDTANKIWASLVQNDQDKVSHEQEFFNQLVKNTLNSAHSKQAQLEENVKKWRSFREVYDQVEEMVSTIVVETERPSSLAGVKSSIARIDSNSKLIKQKQADLDKYNSKAREISSKADVVNRTKINEEQEALNKRLRDALTQLKEQKENLASLALQWDDFELKAKNFSSGISTCQHKFATIDSTFRSLDQMKDIKNSLKVKFSDGEELCLSRLTKPTGLLLLNTTNSEQ